MEICIGRTRLRMLQQALPALVVGLLVCAGAGCSRDAGLSQSELDQIKQVREGGKTEMPAEARKLMEDIAAGRAKKGPPPPDVGQPRPNGLAGAPTPPNTRR